MGLDIRPVNYKELACCGPWAQFAYGGFHRFRCMLASEDGIILDAMAGFGGELPWDGVTSALAPLLNHPDNEGDLTPAECREILPRLGEIKAKWSQGEPGSAEAEEVPWLGDLITVLRYCELTGVNAAFR